MSTVEEKQFQQRVGRIEALIRKVEEFADPAVRDTSREVVQSLLDLHGAGLQRMLDLTGRAGEPGRALADAFAGDGLVANLLLLHGLHPVDLETRVRKALDKVRPYLQSHGGDVALLGAAGGLVRLRMQGSCQGCPSSALTLKLAIEEAVYEAAPDVTGLEVEGVAEHPAGPPSAPNPVEPQCGGSGPAPKIALPLVSA